ncbi:hypothetical protein PCANC_18690 [Puccinia coronata f. sp. avenae]|uniref:SLC41A/MgtE integral membrane domain-containing protein n=1 Tax=Puccinia coronata f. sp. avenae TaxID=200324 RepID=A0A2N5TYY8_9BASI|nr:hypothetical protein PCANC_18690 [Puccinia coronata f. sp. avenae]
MSSIATYPLDGFSMYLIPRSAAPLCPPCQSDILSSVFEDDDDESVHNTSPPTNVQNRSEESSQLPASDRCTASHIGQRTMQHIGQRTMQHIVQRPMQHIVQRPMYCIGQKEEALTDRCSTSLLCFVPLLQTRGGADSHLLVVIWCKVPCTASTSLGLLAAPQVLLVEQNSVHGFLQAHSRSEPAEKRASKKSTCAPPSSSVFTFLSQALPSLLFAVFGGILTGLLLQHIQDWLTFLRVPELFILIPVPINLKGNLKMDFAARLNQRRRSRFPQRTVGTGGGQYDAIAGGSPDCLFFGLAALVHDGSAVAEQPAIAADRPCKAARRCQTQAAQLKHTSSRGVL